MTEPDDQFSGTFAGEETGAITKPQKLTAQQAALAKYAGHAEKQARKPPKKVREPISRGRLIVIVASCLAFCILAGTLFFKLSPTGSFGSWAGKALLLIAVLFIFALLRVTAYRRR